MATYTTPEKVAELLQIKQFDAGTKPTRSTVERIIERKETQIDKRLGHGWRTKTATDVIVYPDGPYKYGTGIRFDLPNRSIRQFTSGTDKIEIFDGSSYVDFVATQTEGRNNDYWVDYKNGIIFILAKSMIFEHGVRVTYRYGESTVDEDIEDLATLMTAIEVLRTRDKDIKFIDDAGTNRPTHVDRIQGFQKEVDTLIAMNQEYDVL